MEAPADSLRSRIQANWANLLLVALALAPLLWNFFILSWSRPAYQFFPMALVAAALLASRGLQAAGDSSNADAGRAARWLAGVAGAICLLAYYKWSPWLGYMAFLAALAAAAWSLGGKRLVRAMLPALLLLAAILPPPLGLDEKLTLWLRTVAVHVSCALLDWARIILVQDGNTIQLPGKTMFVEEACSGINSFILCNVFCLFWFLWNQRPFKWLLLALPATGCFVVLGNVIRITVCTVAFNRWHFDLLEGWRHETFGLVLLLSYCLLIMSTDQLLVFLLYAKGKAIPGSETPKASPQSLSPAPAKAVPGVPAFGFRFAGAILLACVLGICGLQVLRHGVRSLAPLPTFVTTAELKLELPEHLAGWDRGSETGGDLNLLQTTGVNTTSWLFRRNGVEATVAVDYPFGGYHDVRLCYEGNGWRVTDENALFEPKTHQDLYTQRLTLAKSISHAEVLHSDMDQHGNWLSKPKLLAGGGFSSLGNVKSYRIQLITGGFASIPDGAQGDVNALFFAARNELARQMQAQLGKTSRK